MQRLFCRIAFSICLLFIQLRAMTQESSPASDSTRALEEVTVHAFEQLRKPEQMLGVSVLLPAATDRGNMTSLVDGFNSISCVRMEERSPGSYRINVRGSSLRSPFGVRNIKIYWNDIPVTDAGGNSYFNAFALNNFSTIEVFKGPAGSLYGAGTGGLILMRSLDRWQPGVQLTYTGGSYQTHTVLAEAGFGGTDHHNLLTFAHNSSEGYREQSAMRRDNVSWVSELLHNERQTLRASVLYSNLFYETPGGLNTTQYGANPKAARPGAGPNPGSVDAQAAIYQQMLLAGLRNEQRIAPWLRNKTVLYANTARIRNPSIRNYERRIEPGAGGRTSFIFSEPGSEDPRWQTVVGAEYQKGYFNTRVSGNVNGQPDTVQSNDDIEYTAYSIFLQQDWRFAKGWELRAGISSNKTQVVFQRLTETPVVAIRRNYQNEYAPSVSISKVFNQRLTINGTVSRGFSPPTVSELLPSTGVISTGLEAEYGWNYELRGYYAFPGTGLSVEAAAFYFTLQQALVQQRDASGADYFINAGNTDQQGIEASIHYARFFSGSPILKTLTLQSAYAYNHFKYGQFNKAGDDLSGNYLPSVPASTLSIQADLTSAGGLYLHTTYYGAAKIYLDDANTATASPYHLLGARLGWTKRFVQRYEIDFFAGANNLLNEQYSLGNDINAFGGRYFNAAPLRNYYGGIRLQWLGKEKHID